MKRKIRPNGNDTEYLCHSLSDIRSGVLWRFYLYYINGVLYVP